MSFAKEIVNIILDTSKKFFANIGSEIVEVFDILASTIFDSSLIIPIKSH